jgi:hypothetical protein
MGKDAIEGIISVVLAVVGIAMVAVIVGKNSQTGTIISSAGTALSSVLKSATAAA